MRRLGGVRLAVFLEGEHGQSLVEFALALPVFLLLMLGVVDLGRGFYYNNMMANMAREGARYATVAPYDTTGIFQQVLNSAIGLDTPATLTVQAITRTSLGASGNARGNPITITVAYSMYALTPMISAFIPNGLRLQSSSSMLIESSYP